MKVYKLPQEMLSALRKGHIALSHAMIISRYFEKPAIMSMLFKEALTGRVSASILTTLGLKAVKQGLKEAKKQTPKRINIGKKSWIRLEPLQKGIRAEIHLEQIDRPQLVIQKLKELLVK